MDADRQYRSALPDGPVRGRASVSDPSNRFESVQLHVLGDHLDSGRRDRAMSKAGHSAQPGLQIPTQILPDHSKTVINYVSPDVSSDVGFKWTLNPYRGCEHGCIYCYARPTHEYLGFSCGMDFETKIMAKFDAPDLLGQELARPGWKGETIVMSGVTDCYQPIERKLKITRSCLQVLADCHQPVAIITKSRLIQRDIDLLQELARHHAVRVAISVTTLDADLAAKMEPRASTPADRLSAISELRQAGIPVIAMVAPIIPGLNDQEIPAILKAVSQAGAQDAAYVLLRLPWQLKELFKDWMAEHLPLRAAHIESLIRSTRQGRLYDSRPEIRRRGCGPVADQIKTMFHIFQKRYGLTGSTLPVLNGDAFRPPCGNGQKYLF